MVIVVSLISKRKDFRAWWERNPTLKKLQIGDAALYVFQIVFNIALTYTLTESNAKAFKYFEIIYSLTVTFITLANSKQLLGPDSNSLAVFQFLMRIISLVIIALMVLFFCCLIMCVCFRQQSEQSDYLRRVPGLQSFIQSKARSFNE